MSTKHFKGSDLVLPIWSGQLQGDNSIYYFYVRDNITRKVTHFFVLHKNGYSFRAQHIHFLKYIRAAIQTKTDKCTLRNEAGHRQGNSLAGPSWNSWIDEKKDRSVRRLEKNACALVATVAGALKSLKKGGMEFFLLVLPAWCAPGYRCPSGTISFPSPHSHVLLFYRA